MSDSLRLSGNENPPSPQWETDFLGPDYVVRYLPLGADPDGEGELRAALVHHQPATDSTAAATKGTAILYVHGVTDYFFHTHVAEHFRALGIDFFAIDLHKCGRAHLDGQTWHYESDLRHYYDELAQAATIALEHNERLVLLAHSTGGLIVANWLDHLRTNNDPLAAKIAGAIFNSPWLDMIVPIPLARTVAPIIKFMGKKWPRRSLPSKSNSAYGDALHSSRFGSWDYDLSFKPLAGHTKYMGWLRSVVKSQERLHAGKINCGVPVLTLCSAESSAGKPFSERSQSTDAVLNVTQIRRWAPFLADSSTVEAIPGAVHDVFLSAPTPRSQAFRTTDLWLAAILPPGAMNFPARS